MPETRLEETVRRVRLWWESPTLEAFCQASGMGRDAAMDWAKYIRQQDVDLKAMPKVPCGRKSSENFMPEDWQYLRTLVSTIKIEMVHQEQRRADAEAADKRRAKTSQASAWSSVNGDE